MRRAKPSRLTAVHIAATAIDVADRDGLDGLTMRRLARELGVATAALYRYYSDREALLAAMIELAMEEVPAPVPGSDWRSTLAAEATAEWQLYQRHPWLLAVLARTRPPVGPALLDALERSFTALDELDLTVADLLTVYLACSGLAQGLALMWNADRGALPGAGSDSVPTEIAELLDPHIRPTLHRMFAAGPPGPALPFDEMLTAGVELLLDGVAVRYRSET